MIKTKGYWVDDNGNRWSCMFFTKQEAKIAAETLFNCKDCKDCSYCIGCSDCRNCSCCRDCIDCIGCSYCIGCSDCRNCSCCRDCIDCKDCSDCIGCTLWDKNPERIVSPVLGSRDSNTTVYFNENRTEVVCGCFRGDIAAFKLQIYEYHKNNDYAIGYLKWIERVEKYILGGQNTIKLEGVCDAGSVKGEGE